jgi:hypothetical protein
MEISDSEVLLKTLKLKFGDKEYKVPVLRMTAAAEWRKEFYERTREVSADLPNNFVGDPAELRKAIQRGVFGALLKFPEKIPELVFLYAPCLPKEEILDQKTGAYDEDFSAAFKAIWGVAFQPFLASLGLVMETGYTQPSPSASSGSLN